MTYVLPTDGSFDSAYLVYGPVKQSGKACVEVGYSHPSNPTGGLVFRTPRMTSPYGMGVYTNKGEKKADEKPSKYKRYTVELPLDLAVDDAGVPRNPEHVALANLCQSIDNQNKAVAVQRVREWFPGKEDAFYENPDMAVSFIYNSIIKKNKKTGEPFIRVAVRTFTQNINGVPMDVPECNIWNGNGPLNEGGAPLEKITNLDLLGKDTDFKIEVMGNDIWFMDGFSLSLKASQVIAYPKPGVTRGACTMSA